MPGPTLKRPRTFFEHSWPWAILFAVVTANVLAAAYFGIRFVQTNVSRTQAPMFLFISALGVVTLLLVLMTFFYSLRKRMFQERMGGTMMTWLKSHVWLGLVSLAAAIAHASLFPLTLEVSTGKITAVVLLVLVVSGALWRIVYGFVPPRVPGSVGNLSIRDTHRRVGELGAELEKLRAGRSQAFQNAVEGLIGGRAVAARPEGLDLAEQATWGQATDLAARIRRHSVRERRQARFARIMQGWKVLHLPLAAILVGMVAVHIADVFNLDRLFAGEAEKRFASSAECANCHGGIVDEWKLSMHRNAQTSTITVAQTALALANSADFEKLCVNCHAPIGTKFTQKATFAPVAGPANPQAVQEEGVTCIVCHTMPHPPGEMAGASDRLPVGERPGLTSYGTMFGPPLRDPKAVPASAHDVAVGFMTDPISSSQLCGACHNVIADIDGDGIVDQRFAAAGGADQSDSDGDGVLDSNELDVVDNKLQDLVLQTTFNEWQDYLFARGGAGAACIDCHMPGSAETPIIDNPPPAMAGVKRPHRLHHFVGVDYELNIGYYAQPGMPKDALRRVLEERERLLSQSASVSVTLDPVSRDGKLTATVVIAASGEGHTFPTGFAFARQFWLEVSAKTVSGKPVCLAPDPHGIPSPCESGKIATVVEELATCDPAPKGLGNKEIRLAVAAPLDKCDPWLTNFQKILTDGDPDLDDTFAEVAYQSKRADIVKLRVRTADQQVMAPISQGSSARFDYVFDARGAGGEPVTVRAVLRHRHLPPYFVKALSDHYPPGVTAEKLLENMTVVNVFSNEPLQDPRTTPSPESLSKKAERIAASSGGRGAVPGWLALSAAAPALAAGMVARRRRRRSRRSGW